MSSRPTTISATSVRTRPTAAAWSRRPLGRTDWLDGRREELIDRMHQRRERDFGTGYGSSSGYAATGRSSYVRGWRPGVFKFG